MNNDSQENYHIRNMQAHELVIAIELASQEGWNPGLHDSSCFYEADHNGFFIGELDGKIVSVASEVNYDPRSSFFGLYIVKKAYRGMGYGLKMTGHCLNYAGNRNIGLDGVLENVKIYQRLDFKPYFINRRFKHIGFQSESHSSQIKPITLNDFDDLVRYDRQCFFGDRTAFLKAWITQPNSTAVAFVENGALLGYGVCRQCREGFKIGPLFADNSKVAETIFLSLQDGKVGESIYIDIPEINTIGNDLSNKYKMTSVFSVMRMYRHFLPELDYSKIIGISTYELG